MTEPCKLRARVDVHVHCEEETCLYWRAVESIAADTPQVGCAIQHFQLLEGGDEVVAWLLSVKTRVEALEAKAEES